MKGMLNRNALSREAILDALQIRQGDSPSDDLPELPETIWENVSIPTFPDGDLISTDYMASAVPFVMSYETFPWRLDVGSYWADWVEAVRLWLESRVPEVEVDMRAVKSLIDRSFREFGSGGHFDRSEWKAGRLDAEAIEEGLEDSEAIQGIVENFVSEGGSVGWFADFPIITDPEALGSYPTEDNTIAFVPQIRDEGLVETAVNRAVTLSAYATVDIDGLREAMADYVMNQINYNWHAFHFGTQTEGRGE